LSLIEILLGFRFFLKVIGANPYNGFVLFIYTVSAPFTWPFLGIVPTSMQGRILADWSIPLAMIVYGVIAYLLVALFKLASH
jgi:YggT family protein